MASSSALYLGQWSGRVTAHLLLLGATIAMLSTIDQMQSKDLEIGFMKIEKVGASPKTYYYPATEEDKTASTEATDVTSFVDDVHVMNECHRSTHFLKNQEDFKHDSESRKYHLYMKKTVKAFVMTSLILLSVQALATLGMFAMGSKNKVGTGTSKATSSAVKDSYDYAGAFGVVTNILIAVFVAATVGLFFTTIAMRTDCRASSANVYGKFMPSTTDANFGKAQDAAGDPYGTFLTENCALYNRAVHGGKNADPADATTGISFTTEEGLPDTTMALMYMLNCGDDEQYAEAADRPAGSTYNSATDNFYATRGYVTTVLKKMVGIKNATMTAVFLTGFSLVFLSLWVFKATVADRESSFDDFSTSWNSMMTFAWYSIIMGAMFMFMAMKESTSHKDDATNKGEIDPEAWQICSINPDAHGLSWGDTNTDFHKLWANTEEERLLEKNSQAAFIIGCIVLILTWVISGIFTRRGAIERTDQSNIDTYFFGLDLAWTLIPILLGILGTTVIVLSLQPAAQYSATFCSLAPSHEESRMAGGNILVAVGVAALVFLSQAYAHVVNIDGLMYSSSWQTIVSKDVARRGPTKGKWLTFGAPMTRGPGYVKLLTNA